MSHRFALVYRTAAHAEIWAMIDGVPAGLTAAEVTDVLETWARWPSWHARIGFGGSVTVISEAALKRSKKLAEARDTWTGGDVLTWDELAPGSKVIQTPVDGELYARVARDAIIRGVSKRRYVIDALDAYATASGR